MATDAHQSAQTARNYTRTPLTVAPRKLFQDKLL